MKRYAVISIVLVLAVLAGCGGGSGSAGSYEPGVLAGDTYTNQYIGYSFTLPAGWSYATQDELDAMMEAGSELLNDNQKAGLEYSKMATIYDMFARSDTEGSVMVMLENLKMYIGGTSTKPEDYIKTLTKELEAIEDLNYSCGEPYQVSCLGKDWDVVSAEIVGLGAYQTYSVCRLDKYILAVIITADHVRDITDLGDFMKAA